MAEYVLGVPWYVFGMLKYILGLSECVSNMLIKHSTQGCLFVPDHKSYLSNLEILSYNKVSVMVNGVTVMVYIKWNYSKISALQ